MSTVMDNIKISVKGGKKTAPVPAVFVLGELYANTLPDENKPFSAIINDLQDFSKALFLKKDPELTCPTGGSFNNCNGFWTENIYSAFAWNALSKINQVANRKDYFVFVKLPDNRGRNTSWTSLLEREFQNQVTALTLGRKHTDVCNSGHNSFSLSSSNPDAIIVKVTKDVLSRLPLDPRTPLADLSLDTIKHLGDMFASLSGCINPFDNIQCFLSIKKSTRPDRRLQFIHEGNSVKCLLHFLIQRSRSSHTPRKKTELAKKYYAVSLSHVSPKDQAAMDTASISTVQDAPDILIWAVDKLFSNEYPSNILDTIHQIVS